MKITDDIALRALQVDDAIDIFNTIDVQREYLGRWMPFVAFTDSMAFTQGFVNSAVDAADKTYTIRKGDTFIGFIGFKATDKENCKTEKGYWLAEEYQGQGIMTRAVDCLYRYAFKEFGINRVQIKCAVENSSSSNIPKRLKFQYEGIERAGELFPDGSFVDLEIYTLLKNEYHSTNRE